MGLRVGQLLENNKKKDLSEYSTTVRELIESKRRNAEIMRDTYKALNESKGINDNVLRATNDLIGEIPKHLNSLVRKRDKNYRDFYDTAFCFNIKDVGNNVLQTINVELMLYDISDEEFYKTFNSLDILYDDETETMYLSFPFENGKINLAKYKATIQHEMTHCFQHIFRKRDLMLKTNKEELYLKSTDFIRDEVKDTDSDSEKRKKEIGQYIGMVLYVWFRVEQEAFGHELYAELEATEYKSWNKVFQNSQMYNILEMLKKSMEIFSDPQNRNIINDYLKELKEYHIYYTRLLKICELAYDSILKRAARIIELAKNRFGLIAHSPKY